MGEWPGWCQRGIAGLEGGRQDSQGHGEGGHYSGGPCWQVGREGEGYGGRGGHQGECDQGQYVEEDGILEGPLDKDGERREGQEAG